MPRFQFPRSNPNRFLKLAPTPQEWADWTWQVRRSLKNLADFEAQFELSAEERAGFSGSQFQIRTTPYYASLADRVEPLDPIRRIFMPHGLEHQDGVQSQFDPLGERRNSPTPRIIHRYSDRVLFLVTDFCSVYCRYCTRKHFTGGESAFAKEPEYEAALHYIKARPGIREVILSGGDPLTLSDGILARVLLDLRKIDHIEIIRLGSRMPVVNPMRITPALVEVLRAAKPVYVMSHFNHPRELTHEAAEALERLVDGGIPVMNQMVLLNGVNNDAGIVQALSRRLLYLRVKPYYMFQCDPSNGTDHLRTSIEESLQIQRELWGHLSGLAMPNYSIDIPDGGGKTSMAPQFEDLDARIGDIANGVTRRFSGWDGVRSEYKSPPLHRSIKPLDVPDWSREWDELRAAKTAVSSIADGEVEPFVALSSANVEL